MESQGEMQTDGTAGVLAAGSSISPVARLLLALCPAAFVGLVTSLALSPFFAVMAPDLNTSVALLGQVPAVMMLGATGLGLIVGPLADHYGYRRLLLIGTLAVIGSGLVTALAPVVAVLFVAAVFGAASRAIIVPVAFAILSTRLSGEASRRAISRVVIALAAAMVVGTPLLTTIGAAAGWRAAFIVLALIGGVASLLVRRLLPPDVRRPDRPLDLRQVVQAYGVIIRRRAMLGLYAASLLRNTLTWIVGIYMGAFLIQQHGLTLPAVGLAFTAAGAGQLAGGFVFGGRLGRLPLRPLLAGTYLLLGLVLAGFLVLPVAGSLAIALLALAMVFNGGTDVLEPTLLTRETPGGRATTMTLYGAGESLGSALGGAIGGLLLVLGGFVSLGLSLPVLGLGAALLVWRSSAGMLAAVHQAEPLTVPTPVQTTEP